MAEAQDVHTLKRRGRRRLVGAIALVLLAVIVLPMVFDSEPRRAPPPVNVRIPGEDESGFSPKVTPKASPAPAEAVKPEAPKPDAPGLEARAAAEKSPAAPVAGQFVVPVGAYLDPRGVIEKLEAANLPYYTEPLATAKGTVTRVRAGPFASRAAAEKARERLRSIGLKPGNVAAKS